MAEQTKKQCPKCKCKGREPEKVRVVRALERLRAEVRRERA